MALEGMKNMLKKEKAPSMPRDLRLYLSTPNEIIVEWKEAKGLGHPTPVYYTIHINGHEFSKCVSQNESQTEDFRVSINRLNPMTTYRVYVTSLNSKLEGKSTPVSKIYTRAKPSAIRNINVKEGIVTFDAPLYKSYGNIIYDLLLYDEQTSLDAYDRTIATIRDDPTTCTLQFDLNTCTKCIEDTNQEQNQNQNQNKIIIDKEKTLFRIRGRCKLSKEEKEDDKTDEKEKEDNNNDTQTNEEKEQDSIIFSPLFHFHESEKLTEPAESSAEKLNLFKKEENISTSSIIKLSLPNPKQEHQELLTQISKVKYKEYERYIQITYPLTDEVNKTTESGKEKTTETENNDEDVVKILCFSDTHEKHNQYDERLLPAADIILHAGDFTMIGSRKAVSMFEDWGKRLCSIVNEKAFKGLIPVQYNKEGVIENIEARKFKHLVCIAGNHEKTFEIEYYKREVRNNDANPEAIKKIISESKHWTYLEDSQIELCGYKIYGSPWQPFFCNWAFNLARGAPLKKKWELIPKDTDILITHGPPLGHGDKIPQEYAEMSGGSRNVGCADLLEQVLKHPPLIHLFGHIHDAYGLSTQKNCRTLFVNACSVNEAYRPVNKPILICLPKRNLQHQQQQQ